MRRKIYQISQSCMRVHVKYAALRQKHKHCNAACPWSRRQNLYIRTLRISIKYIVYLQIVALSYGMFVINAKSIIYGLRLCFTRTFAYTRGPTYPTIHIGTYYYILLYYGRRGRSYVMKTYDISIQKLVYIVLYWPALFSEQSAWINCFLFIRM